jgi:hypothetical protein
VFFSTCSLTICSISSLLLASDGMKCTKSNRRRSGATQRPGLLHMRSEHCAQCRVKQVRGGVVPASRVAYAGPDLGLHEVARRQRSACHTNRVQTRPGANPDDARHLGLASRSADDADVGHLSASSR